MKSPIVWSKTLYPNGSATSQEFGSYLNFTPSKNKDLTNGLCPSLGETPLLTNMNLPFSPLPNNYRGDISYQRTQYQQRGQVFNELSPFKPYYSPNNQRISDQK